MRQPKLLANALHGAVYGQAGFYAHYHQVQRIGQRQVQCGLVALDLRLEPKAWQMQNTEGPGNAGTDEGNEFRHSNGNRTHHRHQVNPTAVTRAACDATSFVQTSAPSQPAAKTRILEKQKIANGELGVVFNVTMMDNLPADPAAIDMLSGTYITTDGKKAKHEFFKRDGLLWQKDDTPTGGDPFYYKGNNTFTMYGDDVSIKFEPQADGTTKATASWKDKDGKMQETTALKQK